VEGLSIGPWNKWGDPLAGGNRLCRESLLTSLERPTLPAEPGDVGPWAVKHPPGLPHGECGV